MDTDHLKRRIAMEYARWIGQPIFPPLLDALVALACEYADEREDDE